MGKKLNLSGEKTYLKEDDWMFAGVFQEQLLKVSRGGGEHDLVALDRASLAGNGHVTECLLNGIL